MKTEIELDHKVLQKNLELTKALQTIDRLVSENINLNAKLELREQQFGEQQDRIYKLESQKEEKTSPLLYSELNKIK